MKATEQYLSVVLFIMLYKVVLAVQSKETILSLTIQQIVTKQYFSEFIMMCNI